MARTESRITLALGRGLPLAFETPEATLKLRHYQKFREPRALTVPAVRLTMNLVFRVAIRPRTSVTSTDIKTRDVPQFRPQTPSSATWLFEDAHRKLARAGFLRIEEKS